MAKPLGRTGRDGKGNRPTFGAKHAPPGKRPGQRPVGAGAKHPSAAKPGQRPARDDDSEVEDRDDSDEVPASKGRERPGGAQPRGREPPGRGARSAAAPAPKPGRGPKPSSAEPLTFRSKKNKQVDPTGAIELAPFTGAVRESQVIRVQPMARAAKGSQEILFGRIARDCGFINQKALDRCIQAQKEDSTGARKFLGDILTDEELLSRMEVDEILKIQHRNLQKRYKYSGEKAEQALFGRLIAKKELATKEQVNECIRWQAEMERFNEKVPLGELLIAKGYVQDADVEAVLKLQAKGRAKREAMASSGEHPVEDAPPPKATKRDATDERSKKRTKRAAPPDEAAVPEDAGRDKPKRAADAPGRSANRTGSTSGIHAASASGVRAATKGDPSGSGVRAATGEKGRALESSSSLETLGGEGRKVAPQAVVKGWYLGLLGRAYGPLPRRLVAKLFEANALGPDDLFWHQDQDGWRTARYVQEFSAHLPIGSVFTSVGGPPLPLQAKSPKALAESFDALRDEGVLEESDHLKLRKLLTQPFSS